MAIGDVSRGLKRLLQDVQDNADRIAALERMQDISGMEAYAAAVKQEVTTAENAADLARDDLAAILAQIEQARATYDKIEAQADMAKCEAEAAASAILDKARTDAQAVATEATVNSALMLRTANDTAATIVASAEARAAGIERDLNDKRAAIDTLDARMRVVRGQLDDAEQARRRVLNQLGAP